MKRSPFVPLALLLAALGPRAAAADALLVRTLDPATGLPVAGAFVLVGPQEGVPFPGNTGLTAANGTVLFSHPALAGPQLVTAGTGDRAYVSITEAPLAEVTLYLPLRAVPDTLPAPVARVTGRGLGIATQSNDSRFDMGFVLPALDASALVGSLLLGGGALPFAVPPDTANFPTPIGPTPVPGIMTMPAQTEFVFITFQKPVYKIDLPDQTTQSLFCLSGRIAITDILQISGSDIFTALNAFTMREVGIERDLSISNGAVVDVDVDLNLSNNLTLTFGNVPPASKISAASTARILVPGGERYVLYDGKSGLIDQTSTLTLSSMNPAGDLADAVNAVVATHGDNATSPEFLSGIVKRDGFTVPANIAMASFMLYPQVTQNGETFTFTDATNPGVSPSPTWAQGSFSLSAVPGGSGVATTTHWIVYAPAPDLGFTLPALPAGAPAALPDTAATPEADRLRLSLAVNNQTGDAQTVLENPFGDATHFATRTIDVQPATTAIAGGPAAASATAPRLGRAYPDPFNPRVHLPVTATRDAPVSVVIYSTGGRAVRRLTAAASAGETTILVWDGRDERGQPLASGVYIARLAEVAGAEEKLVLLR